MSDKSDTQRKQEFLEAYAQSGRITHALRDVGTNWKLFNRWLKEDENFKNEFEETKAYIEEKFFDDLVETPETHPNPALAKLAADNIKWRLSKLNPERFNEKIDQRNVHTFDLTERFANAVERMQDAKYADTNEALTIEHDPNLPTNSMPYDDAASDSKSDMVQSDSKPSHMSENADNEGHK